MPNPKWLLIRSLPSILTLVQSMPLVENHPLLVHIIIMHVLVQFLTGVCQNCCTHTVADIPGLIPGAHQNKGLGFSFLRHLQRCRLLLFVLDASGPDPHTQLSQLQYELRQYSPSLCSRAGLIVANKMDVSRAASESVQVIRKHTPLPIIPVSALHHWNISSLISALHTLIGSESSKGALVELCTLDQHT